MNIKTITAVSAIALTLSACATSPNKIRPAYISPAAFSNLDCQALRAGLAQRESAVIALEERIRARNKSDKIVTGVGAVLFWPALFFLKGDGQVRTDYEVALGEREALTKQSATRGC